VIGKPKPVPLTVHRLTDANADGSAQTICEINRRNDTGTPLSTFRPHLIELRLVRFSASCSWIVAVHLVDDEASRLGAAAAVNTISRPFPSTSLYFGAFRRSRAVGALILFIGLDGNSMGGLRLLQLHSSPTFALY